MTRLAALALALAVLAGGSAATSQATDGPHVARYRLYSAVNQLRHSHGLPALRVAGSVDRHAMNWAAYMGSTRTFAHSRLAALPGTVLGENVGYGPTVLGVESGFIRSPAHLANLLDRRYRSIGIGVYYSLGRWWVVEDFTG